MTRSGVSPGRTARPKTLLPRSAPPARERNRSWRRRSDGLTGWAMVSPSVLLIGLFGLVPVIWSFVLSFQQNDLQTAPTWVGFDNYDRLIRDPEFLASVRRTLIYTVLFVPTTLILSLLVAAALNRKLRGMTVYRLAVFVPVVTSTIATGVIFTWMLDPDFGLVNSGLHALHLPTFKFFASPDGGSLFAVVIMTVWGWVGFGALIFLAGLQGVPRDLVEAALIDGCSPRGAFWRVQVPLLRPVGGFLLVWLTINALQLFDEVYATTKGGPLNSSTVVVYYLYKKAFSSFQAGYAAAIATALFVVILVVTSVQLRVGRDPSAPDGASR